MLDMALSLSFHNFYNPPKTDVQYQKLSAKYSNAAPIAMKLERAIYALYRLSIAKAYLNKCQK